MRKEALNVVPHNVTRETSVKTIKVWSFKEKPFSMEYWVYHQFGTNFQIR